MLEMEVQHAQSTRDRLHRQLWQLNEETKILREQAETAAQELARVDADYREQTAVLARKQRELLAMEEDLAALRQREAVVKKTLAEVTALEQKAARKQQLLAEAKARNAELDKQLQTAQAAVKAKEDSAQKLLQSLDERMAVLDKLVPQLRAAVEAARTLGLEAGKTGTPPKDTPPKDTDTPGKKD